LKARKPGPGPLKKGEKAMPVPAAGRQQLDRKGGRKLRSSGKKKKKHGGQKPRKITPALISTKQRPPNPNRKAENQKRGGNHTKLAA